MALCPHSPVYHPIVLNQRYHNLFFVILLLFLHFLHLLKIPQLIEQSVVWQEFISICQYFFPQHRHQQSLVTPLKSSVGVYPHNLSSVVFHFHDWAARMTYFCWHIVQQNVFSVLVPFAFHEFTAEIDSLQLLLCFRCFMLINVRIPPHFQLTAYKRLFLRQQHIATQLKRSIKNENGIVWAERTIPVLLMFNFIFQQKPFGLRSEDVTLIYRSVCRNELSVGTDCFIIRVENSMRTGDNNAGRYSKSSRVASRLPAINFHDSFKGSHAVLHVVPESRMVEDHFGRYFLGFGAIEQVCRMFLVQVNKDAGYILVVWVIFHGSGHRSKQVFKRSIKKTEIYIKFDKRPLKNKFMKIVIYLIGLIYEIKSLNYQPRS